jgi:hypothetical protein
MPALRSARHLARLVLVWFALSLGAAIASPLVKPAQIELLCTGSGALKLLVKGDVGGEATSHKLDCPLCAGLDAPPPLPQLNLPVIVPRGYAVQPIPAARIAALVAAPLPARGPPAALVA